MWILGNIEFISVILNVIAFIDCIIIIIFFIIISA